MRKKTWRLLPARGRKDDLKDDQRCRNKRKNDPPLPCEKSLMKSYKNYLYVFGGYGPSPEQYHNYPADSVFELDETSSWALPHGWNANVYRYCIENESWEWVKCKGQYPEPRAGMSNTTTVLLCNIQMILIDKTRCINGFLFLNLGHSGAISNGRLFIFGGRSSSCRLNDIYALDLETHEWMKISSGFLPGLDSFIGTGLMVDRDGSVCDADGNLYPEGRSLHSFTRSVLYTSFFHHNLNYTGVRNV